MISVLRSLGGAFKAGLRPAVGVSLSADSVVLARFERKKKSTHLKRLVKWDLAVPDQLTRREIRPLAKQLMRGVAAARLTLPDIALALPTRYLSLATITEEYQPPKELKNELDLDAIEFFNELEESDVEVPAGALLHYEIYENDKKLDRFMARLAWVDGAEVEPLIELVRQSGLNPVVVDVEIFTIANLWCSYRGASKDLFQKPVAFLEITPTDAHLLVIRTDRWALMPISIHDSDRVLMRQASQLGGELGEFWTEVFDRAYDSVGAALNKLNDWPGAVQLESLVMYSHDCDLTRFAQYVREQHGFPAEGFGFPDTVEVADQAIRYFDGAGATQQFMPAAAVSLRTMNPFAVPAPPNEILRLNFLPEWQDLADTRVFKSSLRGLNWGLIALVLLLATYSAVSAVPILFGGVDSAEVRQLDRQLEVETSVAVQSKSEIESTQALLNGFSSDELATGRLAQFWQGLAPALPAGIVLSSAAFDRAEGERLLVISGIAANQEVFLNFGAAFPAIIGAAATEPQVVLPADAPEQPDPEAPIEFIWRLELGS